MAAASATTGFSADPAPAGSVCLFPGATIEAAGLVFSWGGPEARAQVADRRLEVILPAACLQGLEAEAWTLPTAREAHEEEGFALLRGDGWMLGAAVVPVDEVTLEERTRDLYARMFKVLGPHQLYRCWNWVPAINAIPEGMIERYRLFSRGRSEAFNAAFSDEAEAHMPAASAVGVAGDRLVLVFLAGKWPCHYWENPEQTPAFHYPAQYGPRAPSFSRATSVETPWGRRLFISGTASIKGSESLFEGDVERQAWVTAQNLELITHTAGFGPALMSPEGRRAFRCYLRLPADTERWSRRWPRIWPVLTVSQADICRADLAVEIEGTLAE